MSSGGHNQGLNFHYKELGARYGKALATIAAENATRVQCGHCGVAILPANLTRHESLHEDDHD